MATVLTGSSQPVSLGEGYAIRTPGIRGVAEMQRPSTSDARARARAPRDGTPDLEAAFRETGVIETREIELGLEPFRDVPRAGGARAADDAPAIELQVPDLGPDTGQLVLSFDEHGAVRWHIPVGGQDRTGTAVGGGGGATG